MIIPKGYKETEVGVIPEDWNVYETSKFCSSVADGTHNSPKPYKGSDGFPLLTSKNLRNGQICLDETYLISPKDYKEVIQRSWVKEGDVLFGMIGTVGNVAQVKINEDSIATKNVGIFRFEGDKTKSDWLKVILTSSIIDKQVSLVLTGSTQNFVGLGKIRAFKIPVPPSKAECEAVASILSGVESLLKKLEALIAKKRAIKQGVMQELLTGKRRLAGFSRKWEIKPFGNLIEINKGEQLNRSELTKIGEYPAWNGGIEPSGYTHKWNTDENTITISEGGNSCGFINFCKQRFWCGGHCYALKIPDAIMDRIFLFQYLKFKEKSIMGLRIGSGLPNIQKKSLNELELFVPNDIEEQSAIAQILNDLDAEVEQLKQKLIKYRMLKQGMMQALLTGKVRLV